MSDIFENIPGIQHDTRPACRVTYTLNNSQPVRCTIIGDQPLFYMDFEGDIPEEELLDAADIGILESEIETLKREIETLDRFTQEFAEDDHQKYMNFLDNIEGVTAPSTKEGNADVAALKRTLAKSRMAEAYIAFAEDHGIEIILTGQVEGGHYDRKSGTIFINAHLDPADQYLMAARELRRHWQHRQGALIHPLMFQPDNAVLVNRAQVADLAVAMVRIAWELQLTGVKDAWERIENSSMGDLGRSFAREAFLDFRTLNNGQAAAAVFESWFLSERCRAEDKKLIKQMLADYQGYVFDLDEAGQAITPQLISALGSMPYGKNYLAIHAATIMNDPIFTDVRDRSNANFLWFIKFERSFRETEQELQPEFDLAADGIRRTASQEDIDRGLYDEHAQTAEIVALYPEAGAQADGDTSEESGDKTGRKAKLLPPKDVGKRTKNKQSADIVYLRRWSGE